MQTNEKELKDKQLEELKKQPCQFCGEKQFMTIGMPVIKQNDKGQAEIDPNKQAGIPVCKYHFPIMQTGAFMVTDHPTEKGKQQIIGPHEIVQLIESVIAGQVFSGKLEEMIKAKENARNNSKQKEKQPINPDSNKQCN